MTVAVEVIPPILTYGPRGYRNAIARCVGDIAVGIFLFQSRDNGHEIVAAFTVRTKRCFTIVGKGRLAACAVSVIAAADKFKAAGCRAVEGFGIRIAYGVVYT